LPVQSEDVKFENRVLLGRPRDVYVGDPNYQTNVDDRKQQVAQVELRNKISRGYVGNSTVSLKDGVVDNEGRVAKEKYAFR